MIGLLCVTKSVLELIDLRMQIADLSLYVFISIEINADQCMQGQISDLHAQIDELKDALCNTKKSYHNAEAALTKEHSCVKDLEQELKDLKSYLQSEVNASMLLPMMLATAEPKLQVVVPAWSLPQPEAGPS